MSDTTSFMELFIKRRLQKFKDAYGSMTSTEALQLAVEAEQIYRDLRYPDPAKNYFRQQQADMEEYALLLEQNGE